MSYPTDWLNFVRAWVARFAQVRKVEPGMIFLIESRLRLHSCAFYHPGVWSPYDNDNRFTIRKH